MVFGAIENALISDVHLWDLPGNVFAAAAMLNFSAWIISFSLAYFIFKLCMSEFDNGIMIVG